MKIHEKYMRRCLDLAKNGLGNTYPNPLVGCVIVHENSIIGEGWHQKAGEPHAEVNAINSVSDSKFLAESTIYISLEPCNHFGKTPPCSDLIIAKGIKNVVVGTVDPFSEVAGRGIKKLMDAGCKVIVGVMEKECQYLNKRFFTFHQKRRPYIILKWAQTADGFIAPKATARTKKQPVWITNQYSRQLSHKLRAEEQAILVGTNTVIADDPSLTTREWQGPSPTRIILDRKGGIPKNSKVFNGQAETIILTEDTSRTFENASCELLDFSKDIAHQVGEVAFRNNLQSLIIEGGSITLQTFINSDLWDEAYIFEGPITFKDGVRSPQLKGDLIKSKNIHGDMLRIFKNSQ